MTRYTLHPGDAGTILLWIVATACTSFVAGVLVGAWW